MPLFSFGRFANFHSPGLKYTKYVPLPDKRTPIHTSFRRYIFDQPEQQRPGLYLPNLVLMIDADCTSNRTHGDACDIVVYAPVSTATLFTILETPLYREPLLHDECGVCPGARRRRGTVVQDLQSLSIDAIPPDECAAERAKPRFRPVDAISQIDIEDGAYLHDRAPTHLQGKTYDLTLYNAGTPATENESHAVGHVVPSVIQLFKLAGMQSSRTRLRDYERALLARNEDRRGGKPCCHRTRDFVHRHFRMYFDVPTMKAYISEVRIERSLLSGAGTNQC